MISPDNDVTSDLLVKTWEAVFQGKVLVSDRVLLSPSRAVMVDLVKSISALRQITYLPMILLREFDENQFKYTFKVVSSPNF
jgi:hypothetical protein